VAHRERGAGAHGGQRGARGHNAAPVERPGAGSRSLWRLPAPPPPPAHSRTAAAGPEWPRSAIPPPARPNPAGGRAPYMEFTGSNCSQAAIHREGGGQAMLLAAVEPSGADAPGGRSRRLTLGSPSGSLLPGPSPASCRARSSSTCAGAVARPKRKGWALLCNAKPCRAGLSNTSLPLPTEGVGHGHPGFPSRGKEAAWGNGQEWRARGTHLARCEAGGGM